MSVNHLQKLFNNLKYSKIFYVHLDIFSIYEAILNVLKFIESCFYNGIIFTIFAIFQSNFNLSINYRFYFGSSIFKIKSHIGEFENSWSIYYVYPIQYTNYLDKCTDYHILATIHIY